MCDALRQWRVGKGLNLTEAAKLFTAAPGAGKLHDGTGWRRWEEGQIPRKADMVKLCRLTGLMPNHFYKKAFRAERQRLAA